MALDVLLDSTYLLPSFGLEVERLSDRDLEALRDAWSRGLVSFYCLSVSWVEVIGSVCREADRLGVRLDRLIEVAVRSLLESGMYTWVDPTPEAVELAFELRLAGHRDVIDNLLYATSVARGMIFLTMDETLRGFLSDRGFRVDNLMDHGDLLEMLGVPRK
ncbi:MAG: hypothetical protein DRO06_03785 [Thermoproteota archaeon]|nr:MAG: hypothetical protein DRO06_03785 [Candidatus Korarchaeota archaeon]